MTNYLPFTLGVQVVYDYEDKINQTVFPGLQGGPHNNTIAAIATSMKQAGTKEFAEYARQVVKNAQHLAERLQEKGYKVVTNGNCLFVDLMRLCLTNQFPSLCLFV